MSYVPGSAASEFKYGGGSLDNEQLDAFLSVMRTIVAAGVQLSSCDFEPAGPWAVAHQRISADYPGAFKTPHELATVMCGSLRARLGGFYSLAPRRLFDWRQYVQVTAPVRTRGIPFADALRMHEKECEFRYLMLIALCNDPCTLAQFKQDVADTCALMLDDGGISLLSVAAIVEEFKSPLPVAAHTLPKRYGTVDRSVASLHQPVHKKEKQRHARKAGDQ
jgi:hypothetical protein